MKKWLFALGLGCASLSFGAKDGGLSVHTGFTLVDFDGASGYDEDYLEDWGQFHLGLAAQGFTSVAPMLQAGLEVGYHQLYWYFYRIPFGTTRVDREFEAVTASLLLLIRPRLAPWLETQAGAGVHQFFDSGAALAGMVAAGYRMELTPGLSLPVTLRLDWVAGDGQPTALSLGVALNFHMN